MERSPNISWVFHLRVLCKYMLSATSDVVLPTPPCWHFVLFNFHFPFVFSFIPIDCTHETSLTAKWNCMQIILFAHEARCAAV